MDHACGVALLLLLSIAPSIALVPVTFSAQIDHGTQAHLCVPTQEAITRFLPDLLKRLPFPLKTLYLPLSSLDLHIKNVHSVNVASHNLVAATVVLSIVPATKLVPSFDVEITVEVSVSANNGNVHAAVVDISFLTWAPKGGILLQQFYNQVKAALQQHLASLLQVTYPLSSVASTLPTSPNLYVDWNSFTLDLMPQKVCCNATIAVNW